MDIKNLPPRIPTSTVCKIAGYTKNTLNKRIAAGLMPRPIDRAREMLFIRDDVLKALGLANDLENAVYEANPFIRALEKKKAGRKP